ncbi:MAG: hypothetical protein PF638_01920 [Candidatus Delongbacteria bacterium]|jgi:hypothetical protein|nr:hypothetical protein [Candidatus Delongbacteria bacterium]
MNNQYLNKFIRRSILFISIAFFAILISCSQKYDETGIFDPQDPTFHTDTLTIISEKNTTINNLDIIQDDYLYLGADIAGVDTTAYGEILFNFELFNTDSTLDSAYIIMPIVNDSLFDMNSLKPLDVFSVTNTWNTDDVTRNQLVLEDQITLNFVDHPDTNLTNKCVRIDLNPDSLMAWFTEDSINTNFNGFYLRSTTGDEITPIIKLYSSRWDYDTYMPKVHRFRTDSVLAYDGVTDSLFKVETKNNFSTDLSFVKKESAFLDTADSKFKIGGISGEGIICKIELDAIDSNATVITGRFEIDNDSSDPTLIDPVYGDIRNSSTLKELCVYKVTNSDWVNDITLLEYDTVNVWTYKIEPVETTTLMVADRMMQEWITDPDTNHGFYITSKNWGQPFGYMIFDSLEIKVSYITLTPENN